MKIKTLALLTTVALTSHLHASSQMLSAARTQENITSGTFSTYLESVHNDQTAKIGEGVFDAGPNLSISTKPYGASQVVVCIDTSGSTKYSLFGGRGSLRGGRGVVVEQSADSVSNERQAMKPGETKHIIAAEVEGAARVLKLLASHMRGAVDVVLICFSSNFQLPVDGQLKRKISTPKDMNDFADSLPHILPNPAFGGTSLTPALTKILEVINFNEHTLLTIVTDGQTDDAPQTADILRSMSGTFSKNEVPFDILSIGAGSLGEQVETVRLQSGLVTPGSNSSTRSATRFGSATQAEFMVPLNVRTSQFSHVTGGASTFSGAQCNRGYLEGITLFHNTLGAGVYAGAYRDYSDLVNIVEEMMTGVNDGKPMIFVQSDIQGLWWPAKEHQYKFVAAIVDSEQSKVQYDRKGFVATLEKTNDGRVFVTDERGVRREYCLAPKGLVTAIEDPKMVGHFRLSSKDNLSPRSAGDSSK